jgi:hypothetical protein
MSGRKDEALVLGGEPRVFLLPPEFAMAEKARTMRRYSVLALALVVVLVGAGYAYASYRNSFAVQALAATRTQTQSLLLEQKKYSDATSVARLVSGITEAETLGASTEVLWAGLIDTVRSSLPPGTLIDSAVMKGRAPWEAPMAPAGPLRQPRVATLSIVITSPSILDATTIVRSLVKVPGFADATVDSITVADGIYSTTVTLNVNSDALSGRFAAQGKDATK